LRLLLDTHVFLWWWAGDRKLGAAMRRSIGASEDVFVSAISAWEIVIKLGLGKLEFEGSIGEAIESCGFSELPLLVKHTEILRGLPRHHGDPFDRALIAQAQAEALTIATHDRAFAAYPVSVSWA
jgi:PIN domain nuclease of toxin-antitoxin system